MDIGSDIRMQTEISTKLVTRRSSSRESCIYIIDPIPEFSDKNKKLVIDSWHYVTDHISEVCKSFNFYQYSILTRLHTYLIILLQCFYCRLGWVRLWSFSRCRQMLQSLLHFLKKRTKSFTIFYPSTR